MSHAIKLMAFFFISVALHGAGLWAAAGRYEPHEPDVPAGVAIVDRDLFFRHAERIESQASSPVSATDRITPRSAATVRPSQPGESLASAPAEAAGEAEPERQAPASPVGAMARLDPSIVEPAPAPRREASAPDAIDAERREPARMSGARCHGAGCRDAAAGAAVSRRRARPNVRGAGAARDRKAGEPRHRAAVAARRRPAGGAAPEPRTWRTAGVRHSLQAAAVRRAPRARALARTAADAAMHATSTRSPGPRQPPLGFTFRRPPPWRARRARANRTPPRPCRAPLEAPRLAPPASQPADVAAPR
jgi:hypothetical protein